MKKKLQKSIASSICALFLMNSIPINPAFAEEVATEAEVLTDTTSTDAQTPDFSEAVDVTPTVSNETISWDYYTSSTAPSSTTPQITCDMIMDEMGDTQCVQSSGSGTSGTGIPGSIDPITGLLIGIAGQYLNKDGSNNSDSSTPAPVEQTQTDPVATGTWEGMDLSTIPVGQDDGSYTDQEVQGGFGLEGWGLGILGGIPISDSASYTFSSKGPGGAIPLAKVSPKNPLVGDTVSYGVMVTFSRPNVRVVPPVAYATETYDKAGNYGKDFYFNTVEIVYRGHYAYPRYGYVKVHVNVKVSEVGASGSNDGSGTGQYTGTDGTGNTGNTSGGSIDLGGGTGNTNYGGGTTSGSGITFPDLTGSVNNGSNGNGDTSGFNLDGSLGNGSNSNSSDPWSLNSSNPLTPDQAQNTLDNFYGSSTTPGIGGFDENGNPVPGGAYNADGTLASPSNGNGTGTGYNGNGTSGNGSYNGSNSSNGNGSDSVIGSNGETGSSSSPANGELSDSLFGKIENAITGGNGGLFGGSANSKDSTSISGKLNSLVSGITGKSSSPSGTTATGADASANTLGHNSSVAGAITDAEELMQVAKNLGMTPSYDSGSAWTDPDDSWDLNRVSKIMKAKQALNVVNNQAPAKTNTNTNKAASQPALPTSTTQSTAGALPTQKK